jgi:hypothetical protein
MERIMVVVKDKPEIRWQISCPGKCFYPPPPPPPPIQRDLAPTLSRAALKPTELHRVQLSSELSTLEISMYKTLQQLVLSRHTYLQYVHILAVRARQLDNVKAWFIIVYTCKPYINHEYSLASYNTPRIFSSKMLYFGWWERSWLNFYHRYDHKETTSPIG